MMNKPIAIIPARGGSKRIPRKNLKHFAGMPAITYAINAAKESQIFSEIIVTTDDPEIAEVSRRIGATKIIDRPSDLSDDLSPTVPVIAHAVQFYLQDNKDDNLEVCCIYPVNPFIDKEDLKNGLKILRANPQVSYVLPVCTYPYPVQRSLTIKESMIKMSHPEFALTRSQDLEESFHDAGQWYWGKSHTWLEQQKLLFNSQGIRISRWKCQDIDTQEDWNYAEMLYEVQR
jgi:N-acylneuraminate cytidylyltransferase